MRLSHTLLAIGLGIAASTTANAAVWDFKPGNDPYSDDALLDLSSLNEDEAGTSGFIRLSDDGNSFVRGDGQPIRFWAAGTGLYKHRDVKKNGEVKDNHSEKDMATHCAFMAKRGINMLRLHTHIEGHKSMYEPNMVEVDNIWRFVPHAKQAGIYLTVSPYWAHSRMPKSWESELAGMKEGDRLYGLLWFNPNLQKAYKNWLKVIYTTPNPHTGVALKDEPAIAIIQLQNEDSLLWHSSWDLPKEQKRILGKQYGEWAAERYGSLEKAIEAWGGQEDKGDDLANGILGLYSPWECANWGLTADDSKQQRVSDNVAFYAWRMHQFNTEIEDYLRNELGCKQLTNAMNWKSADTIKLDDAERYSYTANDVIAKNRYTGASQHLGDKVGYRIDPGHFVEFDSVLRNPLQLPTNLKQVDGHPMIITESSWVHPAKYQAEGPFLIAAYQSLSGVDGYYWFNAGAKEYELDPRRHWWKVKKGPRGMALSKWECNHPQLAGMWPANALLYRRGYLQEGDTVVSEARPLESVWKRDDPRIAETETFDPNRDTVDRTGTDAETDISRLAFLIGRVAWKPDAPAEETEVADLNQYIDAEANEVRSTTNELSWNYQVGLCRMDAPKAQGAAGFFADHGEPVALSDVTIESDNHYAAINVVSMDDQPLSRSGQVLIQFGSTARLTGWEVEEGTWKHPKKKDAESHKGEIIQWTGEPPWQLTAPENTVITINNPDLNAATLLDENGYPKEEVPLERTDDGVQLTLPTETMYIVLQ